MEPKIIELIGNPGSGKSSVVNILSDYLSKEYKVFNLSKEISNASTFRKISAKIYYLLLLLFSKPYLFFKLIYKTFKTKQPNIKLTLKLSLNIIYMTSLVLKLMKSKNDYIILDQGILQAIWSINYEANLSFNDISQINRLSSNYRLIYIEVSEKKLLERLNSREGNFSRFEKDKNINLQKSVKILETLYDNFNYDKCRYNNNNKLDEELIINSFTHLF